MKLSFEDVSTLLSNAIGLECCQQRSGEYKSLILDFGNKVYYQGKSEKLKGRFRGEWSFGTYNSSWRISKDDQILLGSQDLYPSSDEFTKQLNKIKFGKFVSLEFNEQYQIIRLNLDNSVTVDFFLAISYDDEDFHVFIPEKKVIEYSQKHGWRLLKSDKPTDK